MSAKIAKLVLQLEDKLSGPAKALGKNLSGTDKALKTFGKDAVPTFQKLQAALDGLKQKSGAISNFREQTRGLNALKTEFSAVKSRYEQLRAAFQQNPTGKLKSEFAAARSNMQAVATALREQAAAASQAKSGLSQFGMSVRTLKADADGTESAIKRLQSRLDGFRQHAAGGLPPVQNGGDGTGLPAVPDGEERRPTGRNGGRPAGFLQRNGGKLVATAGTYLGMQTLYNGAKQAMTGYAEQDRRLSRILITADADQKKKSEVLRKASAIAMKTGLPLDQVVNALEVQVSLGESLDNAMSGLEPIAITAQASGAEPADVATTLYGVRRSLKVPNAEIQGSFDRLVGGGKLGAFEAPDAAKHLPTILPLAASLGYEGNDGLARVIAALQVIRARSGDSSQAATNFENVLSKLYMKETADNFSDFGIDFPGRLDAARKKGGDPLTTLISATQEATKGDLSKLPLLFGDMQAQAGIRALIQGQGDFERFTQQLANFDGSTLEDFGKIADDTKSRLENMGTSVDRLTTSIGATIAKLANPGLKWLADKSQESDDANAGYESMRPEDRNRNRREFMRRWSASHPNAWPWEAGQAYGDALGKVGRGEGGLFDGLPAVPDPVTAKPLPPHVLAAMDRAQRDLGSERFEGGMQRVGRGLAPAPVQVAGGAAIEQGKELAGDLQGVLSGVLVQPKIDGTGVLAHARAIAAEVRRIFADAATIPIGGNIDHQITRSRQTTMTGGERF